jgi:hypothetical protein
MPVEPPTRHARVPDTTLHSSISGTLDAARRLYTFANGRRVLAWSCVAELLKWQRRDVDVEIDAVRQGAGQAGPIALNVSGGTVQPGSKPASTP